MMRQLRRASCCSVLGDFVAATTVVLPSISGPAFFHDAPDIEAVFVYIRSTWPDPIRAAQPERRLLDPNAPLFGNPDGDVTVVEFFDYNFPQCKRAMPEVDALLAKDGNIRLVFREWPIVSEGSAFAARAALASRKQGKYAEMHTTLAGMRGKVEPDAVLRIASEVGLDLSKLKADLQSPEVEEHFARSMRLAEALGFSGTPSFVVGDQLIPGFVEKAPLAEVVSSARGTE